MNGKRVDAIFACVGGGGLLSGNLPITSHSYHIECDFYTVFQSISCELYSSLRRNRCLRESIKTGHKSDRCGSG